MSAHMELHFPDGRQEPLGMLLPGLPAHFITEDDRGLILDSVYAHYNLKTAAIELFHGDAGIPAIDIDPSDGAAVLAQCTDETQFMEIVPGETINYPMEDAHIGKFRLVIEHCIGIGEN
jgi:hypothetical protein